MNRPLESLFAPASVAVVGASEQPTKWGYWLSVGALTGRERRSVHLVNRRGGALDGVSFAPSLAALGEPVELVVVATPAAQFSSTVDEALAAGAKAVVGITAGLSRAAQAEVAARVRAAGAVLLGPNCMGVADAAAGLRLLWGELPAGDIALVSQSGNLALELGAIARRGGLGFSRFASLGNAADVTAVELLRVCAAHPATRAVAVYLEDVGDGRAFVAAAAAAVDAGTPVVLLTAGRSAEGARAARSHTGALAGDAAVLTAACRAAGVRLVATPTELIEATRVAAIPASVRAAVFPAAPRRLGVVADGGGHGVIAADLAVAARLAVPGFSDDLAARLAALLPPAATTGNPVDLAGGGERDITSYAAVVAAVLESSEVDAVLLSGYFGSYCEQGAGELAAAEGEVADAIAAVVHRTGRPVYVHSMAARSSTAARLAAGGVPVWSAIEQAVAAAVPALRRPGPPELPRPAGAVAGDAYWAGRELLAAAGVAFPPARAVRSRDDALVAAGELGYPVVLKALGLAHKSDVRGVALGLDDAAAVAAAFDDMAGRLAPAGYAIETMVELREGVELIVGARRDPRFGPVLLVGFGGVYAELIADTAVDLAPVDRDGARDLLARLRGAALLAGFRGRPAVDLDALADVIVAVSRVAAAHPEIAELDLNPVLATPHGAVALDCHWELAR
ncbi:acyl-CoA synthetase (NDP forming) [Micromonospora kangleipakensis]|uniref:Acyl-CoA synthetase (NDP forming) n=1 Tax=Micromonospora kangleipakensis TaxID=1077942 RepID=A0A4Q8BE52_9ACTN|nr:acetate--CoA ligase family protein [Micromonospora kangleipakensis]RZU75483.1 acyl-CoA synthetase (NDP forming) [Micromonospora kangleipakensis]